MSQLARQELRRSAPGRPTALTIGTFDGVHRGHQYLIAQLKERARRHVLATGVITLYPNPVHVLRPQEPVVYLTSLEERLDLLQATDVDFVAPLTFTPDLAEQSPEAFAAILVDELQMRYLLMGPDHAFGRNREGTADRMARIGGDLGFEVELLAEPLANSTRPVSSTTIRTALADGDIGLVTEQLGRCYSLQGPVIHGDSRGRALGYPTANIAIAPDRALPAFGVYATWAYLGETRHASVTNIGTRPTFDGKTVMVETYIMDFDAEIYGETLRIDLVARVSDEVAFTTIADLERKIESDVAAAREALQR